ncbi:hypothetical protein ScPMuIL_017203 [Solemya velum]
MCVDKKRPVVSHTPAIVATSFNNVGRIFSSIQVKSLCELSLMPYVLATINFAFRINNVPGRQVNVEILSSTRLKRTLNKRSTNHFPSNLPVRFPLDGQLHTFQLQRNDGISTDVPVYVMRNGEVVMEQLQNAPRSCLYRDLPNGASFHVTAHRVDGEESYTFDLVGAVPIMCAATVTISGQKSRVHTQSQCVLGSFVSQQTEYVIHPVEDKTVTHQIVKLQPLANFTTDSIYPDTKEDQPMAEEPRMRHRSKRATGEYKVEILFAVDYSVYNFWYTHSSGTPSEKDLEAKESIRQFYSFVLNGMATRYAGISGVSFSITPVFAGIFIADSAAKSYWSETVLTVANLDRPAVDATNALEAFKSWSITQPGLPKFDHAMTSTAYDLLKGGSSSNAGLAYQDAACSDSRESIIEDHINFNIMTVAAHELGHNLGAVHDGDGNFCSGDDNYIMAATTSYKTGTASTNPWKFSSCSIQSFDAYLNKLNSGTNCLIGTSPEYNETALAAYDGQYPGQIFSIDKQCQLINSDSSYMCRSFYGPGLASVCTNMYCSVPGTSDCSVLYAAERTPCGDKKIGNGLSRPRSTRPRANPSSDQVALGPLASGHVPSRSPGLTWQNFEPRCVMCVSGFCVGSDEAQSLSEECPFGDSPGIFRNGLTCAEYIPGNKLQCTVEYTRLSCCASCAKAKTGIPDCGYGDKATGCQFQYCSSYTPSSLLNCCETCYDGPPITKAPTTTTQKPVTATTPKVMTTTTRDVVTTTPKVLTTTPKVVTTTIPVVPPESTVPTTSTTSNVTEPPTTIWDTLKDNVIIIAASVGGGIALIIVIVVSVCLCRTKKPKRKLLDYGDPKKRSIGHNGIPNPNYVNRQDRISTVTGNRLSAHPPLQGRLSGGSYRVVGEPNTNSYQGVHAMRGSHVYNEIGQFTSMPNPVFANHQDHITTVTGNRQPAHTPLQGRLSGGSYRVVGDPNTNGYQGLHSMRGSHVYNEIGKPPKVALKPPARRIY